MYGWEKKRAITQQPQKRVKRSYWKEIALRNGINESTFKARINRHGWSEEKAAKTPVIKTKVRNRKYSDEIYKRLKENGISKQLFYDRIHRGWDVERAITRKKFTNLEKAKFLSVNNSYFKNLNNLHWAVSKSKCLHKKI